MDMDFTEEQEMLRASAREFLEKECTESIIQEIEASGLGYSPDLWKKIAGLGWLGLIYPEEYGGAAMNVVDLTVLCEEMGRAMFPSPYLSSVVLCGLTILKAGSDKQKSEILPKMISGDEIIALAMTEPKSGWEGAEWDAGDVTTLASRDGNAYLLEGVKLFVHGANIAGSFLVPARTQAAGDLNNNITLFLVDARTPGIRVTRLTTMTGHNQCEVIFNRVPVSEENIIGPPNGGWTPLSESIQIGAVMLSAQMLGAGERLLELSVEDHESRLQFAKPGEADLYDQEHMAHLLHYVNGCRWTTYQAARQLANGQPCDFEMTVVKGWSKYAGEEV